MKIKVSKIRPGDLVNEIAVASVMDHPSGIALLTFGGHRIMCGLKPNDEVEVVRW